jgi:hypothetical protein
MHPIGPRHLTRLLLPFALGVSLGCHGNGPTAPPPLCQVTTPPGISFTSVPPAGSSAAVMGNVSFTTPPCSADNYRVALFILVPPFSPTTYICKPTQTQPLTTIGNDGSWSAQYVSGGLDSEATQFRAFLVTPGFTWPCFTPTLPSVNGTSVLAVAKASR